MVEMMQLYKQHNRLEKELRAAVESVVESCHFIKGEAVVRFEKDLAAYLGCKHVISCGNGTDALFLAIKALDIPANSEIITTSLSFVAAAEAIALLGHKPIFTDVDETYNMSVSDIERLITANTKAIIVTHLFGCPCDMKSIMDIARKHNLYVIEDAAQSLGGWCDIDGERKKLGTIGHIGCTSFFPSKNLGCWGDGGAAFTNDDTIAEEIRKIANHGGKDKYSYETFGINSRLDTIQAAVLEVKLRHLDEFNAHRKWAAKEYGKRLSNVDGITLPIDVEGSVYHQYTIRVADKRRDSLRDYLADNGVKTMIYYPKSLHLQEAYREFTSERKLEKSERMQDEVLSLPICSEIGEEEIETICKLINEWGQKN